MKIEHKQAIITSAQQLAQARLIVAGDGNISFRCSPSEIWMTPKGVNKARLKIEDLACVTESGEIMQGIPSSEHLMHLEIYRQVPEAKAVVHAHPPHAIALSLARYHWKELPVESLPEIILAAGKIPIVPYARPGTPEMGTVLRPFLPQCRLLILSRHGALCWGESLEEATDGIERLEQVCQILKLAEEMGGAISLPSQEILKLKDLRRQIGNKII